MQYGEHVRYGPTYSSPAFSASPDAKSQPQTWPTLFACRCCFCSLPRLLAAAAAVAPSPSIEINRVGASCDCVADDSTRLVFSVQLRLTAVRFRRDLINRKTRVTGLRSCEKVGCSSVLIRITRVTGDYTVLCSAIK